MLRAFIVYRFLGASDKGAHNTEFLLTSRASKNQLYKMRDCNVLDSFVGRLDASPQTFNAKSLTNVVLNSARIFDFPAFTSNPAAGGNSHCKIIQ